MNCSNCSQNLMRQNLFDCYFEKEVGDKCWKCSNYLLFDLDFENLLRVFLWYP